MRSNKEVDSYRFEEVKQASAQHPWAEATILIRS